MTYVSLYLLMVVIILSYSSTLNAFTPYTLSINNKNTVGGKLYMSSTSTVTEKTNTDTDNDNTQCEEEQCEVLLLDHLNINHEKGRHDALKAFYFDFLGMAIDPRKYENYESGKKTLWANIGMHQFHLPEGKPDAQVFNGLITLVYDNLDLLMNRYKAYLDGDEKYSALKETEFLVGKVDEMMLVTDPWGSQFCILKSDDAVEDRAADVGAQPVVEEQSEGLCLEDLTVYVEHGANLDGIGRFYEKILGAPTIKELSSAQSISIAMGERQTLTFQYHPDGELAKDIEHHDFSYDDDEDEDLDVSLPAYPSNHGVHISLYVTNLSKAYQMAEELGVLYVNPRFSRRAYTEEEAIDQCMFRLIQIVDPLDEEKNVILNLEHEVRSCFTKNGTKYKSCPLINLP